MNAILGRTELSVCKDGFGALPIQRADSEQARYILRRALDIGINFFDTAAAYTDSEEKIGNALSEERGRFILATKVKPDISVFWESLENSLKMLKTDHIDIFQLHNPSFCPKPDDGSGLYEAMLKAKEQGKIRFIGISNHRMPVARSAVESGLYDTLQFPFSYLSNYTEIALVKLCADLGVGFIAMKALSGGLISDIGAARSWINQFENVVPIWGIQRKEELESLTNVMHQSAGITPERQSRIDHDRAELTGAFCRGCSYCMPCPQGIQINPIARLPLFLRRSPVNNWLSDDWKAEMENTKLCNDCKSCIAKCPYGLDIPDLLKKSYDDYMTFL